MCYMRGVATHMYKLDDHYPIRSKLHYGCLLSFCGPTTCMYVATLWRHITRLCSQLSSLHCEPSLEYHIRLE